MDDDFNTSLALAVVFELVGTINSALGAEEISENSLKAITCARDFINEAMDVFGISFNSQDILADKSQDLMKIADELHIDYDGADDVADKILEARVKARAEKN